jgi:hypothetical protein
MARAASCTARNVCRLLYRQLGGLFAPQNTPDIHRGLTTRVKAIRAIAQQAACEWIFLTIIEGWDRVAGRPRHDPFGRRLALLVVPDDLLLLRLAGGDRTANRIHYGDVAVETADELVVASA